MDYHTYILSPKFCELFLSFVCQILWKCAWYVIVKQEFKCNFKKTFTWCIKYHIIRNELLQRMGWPYISLLLDAVYTCSVIQWLLLCYCCLLFIWQECPVTTFSYLKAYVSEEILNWHCLSLNANLCIHFYWLSRLR